MRKFYACWCENFSKQKYHQQYLGERKSGKGEGRRYEWAEMRQE